MQPYGKSPESRKGSAAFEAIMGTLHKLDAQLKEGKVDPKGAAFELAFSRFIIKAPELANDSVSLTQQSFKGAMRAMFKLGGGKEESFVPYWERICVQIPALKRDVVSFEGGNCKKALLNAFKAGDLTQGQDR